MAEQNAVDRQRMEERLRAAIAQLERSSRGQRALYHLSDWLRSSGFGLDAANKESICVVLESAWGPFRGTAGEIIANAITNDQGPRPNDQAMSRP